MLGYARSAYDHGVTPDDAFPGGRRSGLGVAGGLFLLLTALILVTPNGPGTPVGYAAAIALAAVQAATLAVIRRQPEAAMAVAILAGVGLETLSPDIGWLGQVAAVLAAYAWLRPPSRSLWVLALLIAGTPWKLAEGGDWTNLMLAAAGPALGWALGELGRTRWLRRADLERRIVTQERERIARELHDVLAHTVSVIVVQAGAARDVFDARPEMARTALERIDAAARATLAELRMLLQTMSAGDGPDPDGPQPGLDQLDSLAASLRATGLRVELDQAPNPGPLPAAVDLSAYRIVQESLTNTLRHSQSGRARVVVRHDSTAVRLEISDDGPARPAGRLAGETGRRGIVGMRERARLLGGTLDAGPRPGGGFAVTASLPLTRS
jgi:signal transduction histidine kinase